MRVAEGNVCRVKRTEAAAVRNGARVLVLTVHKRNDIIQDVVFKMNVSSDAISRVTPKTIKCLVVDAVDAEKLHVTGVDFVSQAVYQTQIFVFVESTVSRGKNQDLGASVTKDQQFHISA